MRNDYAGVRRGQSRMRWLLAVAAGTVMVAACAPVPRQGADDPSERWSDGSGAPVADEARKRILELKEFVIAHETDPRCKLQIGAYDPGTKRAKNWRDLQPNEFAGGFFKAIETTTRPGAIQVLAFHEGRPYYLRNKTYGWGETESLASRWHCVVGHQRIAPLEPSEVRKYYQLDMAKCPGLTPVFGSVDDISSSNYTLTEAMVFVGAPRDASKEQGDTQGKLALGVKLEAEGGQKRLWIPTTDLKACFRPADRPPPPPREAARFLAWLDGLDPDATPPPHVSIDTVEAVIGIDREQCLKTEFAGAPGLVCHTPVLQRATEFEPGPFGPHRIQFTKNRAVSGLHFKNGWLVSAEDAVTVQVAVQIRGLAPGSPLREVLNRALQQAIENPERKRERAVRGGFSLLPVGSGETATHVVNVELDYRTPELKVTKEPRTFRYGAGSKMVANPEYARARRHVDEARSRLESAEKEAEMVRQEAKQAQTQCGESVSTVVGSGGSVTESLLKMGAKAVAKRACNKMANRTELTTVARRVEQARAAVQAASRRLKRTPRNASEQVEKEHEYEAIIYRRRGTAKATTTITAEPEGGGALFQHVFGVPFDVTSVEIPSVPAVGLRGQDADAPSEREAYQALARAAVLGIDRAILKWGTQRQVGGDVGEVQPGTRSWMVLVARQAASYRPVKLLSDILDTRAGPVSTYRRTYPVRVPEGASDRCFTFAAIDRDSEANIDLELYRGRDLVALDERSALDAAFELCRMSDPRDAEDEFQNPYVADPWDYTLVVKASGEVPEAVLVSMFESTPGKVTDLETSQATRGIPTMAREGEKLALDGTGIVSFKGTGGKVVIGRTGDRDGDGIPDSGDRCPYEPEEFNLYLDGDGCPDERPPGWTPSNAAAP